MLKKEETERTLLCVTGMLNVGPHTPAKRTTLYNKLLVDLHTAFPNRRFVGLGNPLAGLPHPLFCTEEQLQTDPVNTLLTCWKRLISLRTEILAKLEAGYIPVVNGFGLDVYLYATARLAERYPSQYKEKFAEAHAD